MTSGWPGLSRKAYGEVRADPFSPLLLDRLHSCRSSVLLEHLSLSEMNRSLSVSFYLRTVTCLNTF